VPSKTPTETLTPVPSETPTETPIPSLESLPTTRESVSQFATAMQKAGISVSAEQILQQGLQFQTVTGVDGKQYEIAFAHLDPDPSKQGETLEGNYPLMIKSDSEQWEEATLGNIGTLAGKEIGVSYGFVTSPGVREAAANFNSVEVAWDLRWDGTEPSQGVTMFGYNSDKFSYPDREVDYAIEHGQSVVGMPLIDWNSYPAWLTKGINEKTFTPDQVKEFVKNRIVKTMEQYKGKINTWVVVNEFHPISLGWHEDVLQKSLGDYTEFAFQTAREEADKIERETGKKVVLLYNDSNNEFPSSPLYARDLALAKRLHDKGLIDGMGLQMHILLANDHIPTYEEIKTVIEQYKAQGIPVHITELDINLQKITGSDAELKQVGIDPSTLDKNVDRRMLFQERLMENILRAALDSGNVDSITFFGLGDEYGWLNKSLGMLKSEGTLFDKNMQPKVSYYAVLKSLLPLIRSF
jgi:endo-1,4-beta-xylanase